VLDIGLLKLDGFQAARRIRAKEWGKNVALVAVSGWCRDEDRQNSADAGFDGHLAKPVPVEQIRNLIQGLLIGRRRGLLSSPFKEPRTNNKLH
jgi:CheY-like chemotaxis protein